MKFVNSAATAAKSLQSCPTLCDPIDGRLQADPRLPRPWDSPSKNTEAGCHFLLQCMKVKSESEVSQSCPTVHDPMDCSLPGSSAHGIFQARVLEWGAVILSSPLKKLQTKIAVFTYKQKKCKSHKKTTQLVSSKVILNQDTREGTGKCFLPSGSSHN